MRSQVLQPTMRCLRAGACVMTLALLSACASTPPPTDQIQRAQNAITQAQQAHASDYDPVDLQFATGKFQQAQAAMANRDYDTAAMRAEEAQADAQLAFTKSRLAVERQKIQTQTTQNAQLRQQLLSNDSGDAGNGGSSSAPASSGSTLTLPERVLPQPPAPASSAPSNDSMQGGGA